MKLSGAILLICIFSHASASGITQVSVADTLHTAEDCLGCHAIDANLSDRDIEPQGLFDAALDRDFRVDAQLFALSNHGGLACRICHIVGKEGYPHLEAAQEQYLDCVECHERQIRDTKYDVPKITAEFEASLHYQKLGDKFSCYSCHDPHIFDLRDAHKDVTLVIRDDNAICLRCHDDSDSFAELSDRDFPERLVVHAWLPNRALHWNSVRCVECHTQHTESFAHNILGQDKAERDCVVCHSRDSILLTTLYKYEASQERQRVGAIKAAIFGEPYVIGMTRNEDLDRWSIRLLLLTVLALGGHGLLRIFFAAWRSRR